MRIVLDTNVVVAALRSPSGASAALLLLASQRVLRPVVSPTSAVEYEAVLLRPQHGAAAGLRQAQVQLFVDRLLDLMTTIKIHVRWRPLLLDPDDEHVLEAAISGRAEAIITFNSRDFGPAPMHFGIRTLTPRAMLEEITR